MAPQSCPSICSEHGRLDERTTTIKDDVNIAFDLIRKNQATNDSLRQKDREDTAHAIEAVHIKLRDERTFAEARRATDLKEIATSMKALSDSIQTLQQNSVRVAVILSGVLFVAAILANKFFAKVMP